MTPYYLKFPDAATGNAKLREAELLIDVNALGEKITVQHAGLSIIGESWRPTITPTIRIEKFIVEGVGTFDTEAEAKEAKAAHDAARIENEFGALPPEAKILLGVSHVRDESKPIIPASKRDGYFVNWIGNELPAILQPYVTNPATPFRVFAGHSPEEIAAKEAISTLEHEGTPQ